MAAEANGLALLWTDATSLDNSIVENDAVRVLVVDDEDAIRSFARRALQLAGYHVREAADGAAALKVASEHGPFGLALIDLIMPSMNGDELARRLRCEDPDLKVLYFTGYADRLFADKPTLWDQEAFLDKPVTIAGLQEAVSLLLFGHIRGLPPRS